MSWEHLVEAARQGRGPLKHARAARRYIRGIRLPVIRPLIGLVAGVVQALGTLIHFLIKFFIREPYFRYRCSRVGARLNLQGAVPQIFGNGIIEIGDDVTIGNQCTWDLAYSVAGRPSLVIGHRVSVNFRNIITVAKRVEIGDDTMVAGNVTILDNASHPISPARRRAHDQITAEESAPIIIGRNCWIGLNSVILRGVSIGDNSIVAANSVVTKSVAPNTIVAGNPAAVIRTFEDDSQP